jgi:hypothetical protein
MTMFFFNLPPYYLYDRDDEMYGLWRLFQMMVSL